MYLFRTHSVLQNLDVHIKEEIFKSLSGQDLLNCAGLCTSFYAIISKEEHFTDKIVFKTGREPFKDYDMIQEYLNQTTRTYKHIKIEHEDYINLDLRRDKFDWKSLQISRLNFTNDVYLFIDQFAETIEELEFHNIRKVFDINTLAPVPEYPNIRSFKSNCTGFVGSFIVWLFRFRLRPITNLTICYDAFKFDIFEDRNGSTLSLSNLTLTGVHNNPHINAVLNNFLISQKDYLVDLEVSQLNDKLLESVWNKMDIRKLTIGKKRNFDYHFKDIMKLEMNSSIEELIIKNEDFPGFVLNKMYENTNCLETLRVTSFDEECLLYTRLSAKTLKALYIDEYVGDPNDDRFLSFLKLVKIKEIVTRAEHVKRMNARWSPQTPYQIFRRKVKYYIFMDLFGEDPGTMYNPELCI
ncbi:unnamed protein product [Diamesa serratosioi]